jgi:regulator of replication initiation timing
MRFKAPVVLLALLSFVPLVASQSRRDPLTEKEVDQLRETAQEPEKRLKLMVDFTRQRLQSIEQLRSDTKAKDRGQKIHDLLEDVTSMVDELDDNIDDYSQRGADLRKPLKQIVELDTELQIQLRQLRDAASDPKVDAKTSEEIDQYKFALQDATSSVNTSADSARKELEAQNTKFAAEKKKK